MWGPEVRAAPSLKMICRARLNREQLCVLLKATGFFLILSTGAEPVDRLSSPEHKSGLPLLRVWTCLCLKVCALFMFHCWDTAKHVSASHCGLYVVSGCQTQEHVDKSSMCWVSDIFCLYFSFFCVDRTNGTVYVTYEYTADIPLFCHETYFLRSYYIHRSMWGNIKQSKSFEILWSKFYYTFVRMIAQGQYANSIFMCSHPKQNWIKSLWWDSVWLLRYKVHNVF